MLPPPSFQVRSPFESLHCCADGTLANRDNAHRWTHLPFPSLSSIPSRPSLLVSPSLLICLSLLVCMSLLVHLSLLVRPSLLVSIRFSHSFLLVCWFSLAYLFSSVHFRTRPSIFVHPFSPVHFRTCPSILACLFSFDCSLSHFSVLTRSFSLAALVCLFSVCSSVLACCPSTLCRVASMFVFV